jgi:serine protease AprX
MKRTHKLLHVFLVIGLLAGLIGASVLTGQPTGENVHPLLAHIAADSSDQMVAVIVQTYGDSSSVISEIESLGGTVTKDLHIINAVSAELSAEAAMELSGSSHVRWISLDAPVMTTGRDGTKGKPGGGDDGSGSGGSGGLRPSYAQVFLDTTNTRDVWNMGLDGDGIAVAIIDSGIFKEKDLDETASSKGKDKNSASRVIRQMSFSSNSATVNDVYGHGTHIAGIVGGNGKESSGEILGIAPKVDLISLKISDEEGLAFESDTVEAVQWVLDNKDTYNIRVVNLSIRSTMPQSYHTSPLDAAAEILWFNGIVVVASAGNEGPNAIDTAPANDPFIITVGASDEMQTADPADDVIAPYSAFGITMDGFAKPDIIAPGQDIVSLLASTSDWNMLHPERLEGEGSYFRLSGTSMSAPMVVGAAVLLLQDEPNLTPDQVKYRLMASGRTIPGVSGDTRDYPYLDVLAAVTGTSTESANTGLPASQLLWTGSEPLTWESVNWNSVNWNSVNWNSVNWNSVNWNSVNWNSVAWDN